MKYKFYQLGVSVRWRSLKLGAENASNEWIAEQTNETNRQINEATNRSNREMQAETNAANERMTRETNEWNAQLARENNDLQIRLQEQSNEFNRQMWEMNNQYNSPKEQVARATEAGINPNMVFGSPVASQPVQQTSIPQTSPATMQPARAEAAKAVPYTAISYPHTPEGSIAGSISRTIGDINQTLNAVGQHYVNENQRMHNDFVPAMLASGLQYQGSQTDLNRAMSAQSAATRRLVMKQADGITQNILESQQKVKNMQAELNILNEKDYQSKIDSAFYYDEKNANLESVRINNQLSKSQMYAITQRLKIDSMVAYATANNLNWQAEIAKKEVEWKQSLLDKGMPEAEISQVRAATRLACSQETEINLRNDVYSTYGADLMKYNVEDARYKTTTLSRFINGSRDFMMSAGAAALLLK